MTPPSTRHGGARIWERAPSRRPSAPVRPGYSAENVGRETRVSGHVGVGQRRHAQGRVVAGEDRLHRRVQGSRRRAPSRRQAQCRRGRSRRPGRAWRRDAGRVRLPARLVSILGTRAGTRRLRLWPIRRELHRRRTQRRGGLHQRPVPDRHRDLRGDATPGHLLPRRDPDERPAHSGVAGLTPSPGLLFPGAPGGRGAGGR